MKEGIRKELLSNTQDFKGFREADIILEYLRNPDGDSSLTLKQKQTYERYLFIHGLRMKYKSHMFIIKMLKQAPYSRTEKQARTDIAEAEYMFGKAISVSAQYERAFLLEIFRKNISIAVRSKDSKAITAAIKAHSEILGEDIDLSALPDPTKFEQHNYNIVLPGNVAETLKAMVSAGAINLNDILPAKSIQISANDEENK